MSVPLDTLLVLLILTNFLLLGSSRLSACIRIGALQGIVAGILPLSVSSAGGITLRIAVIAVVIMGLKGFVFPYLLSRALRESDTSREVQPFVGYAASLFVGVLSLLASFWLDARLEFSIHFASDLVVPVAFSMMMTGLFLMVARRTAVNQVMGYIVLENGIYTFGLAIARDIPALIELGVLMDMFVAVFVMGIAIYRINREFDHIDSDRLNTLKG
jgi:hydrogenase-4 component E